VTQDELTAQLQEATNSLRSLLYQNESAPNSLPASGGYTNEIALTSDIDQLNGTALNNVIVNGVSGLTASEIPNLSGDYLSLNGGSLSGSFAVTGTTTLASSVTTIGGNLITNGNFNGSATGWTLGSSVEYGTNDLISTYSPDHAGAASTTFPTVAGDTYLLTFTVPSATGNLFIYLSHDTLNTATGMQGPFGNGTHTVAFQTNFTGRETITFDYWDGYTWGNSVFGNPAGETWTLSNVSINQITSPPSPALVVTGYDGSTWLSLGADLGEDVAVGQNALRSDTLNNVGNYNTAIGGNALYQSTTGNENTAVGWNALYSNTTGGNNTAIGPDALFSNTSGGTNTAIGEWTLYNNTTGDDNSAEGSLALFSNTTGRWNSATGYYSLFDNTTGSNNVANGLEALQANTTGSNNAANGFESLYYNGSATDTVAEGYQAAMGTAAYSNQGGTAVGYQSGYSLADGSNFNTLLGYQSGYGITTGSNNIWIGTATSSAGIANLTTGSQNISIGNNISLPSATANGQLDIGNIIYGTGITGTGSTISSGNIGIGTTTPPQPLSVIGSAYVSGLLGVGTANPATNLDGTYGVEIEGNAATSYTLTSFRNSVSGGNITLNHERGTQASPLVVNTGDAAGTIYFQVLDPLTSQLQEVADIHGIYNGNDGSVRDDGALVFDLNSSADEVMRIVADTNDVTRFGFGTAAPAATFDFQTQAIAASGNTYGMRLQQTLLATSSNVSLNALYINPTFNNNSKSNVAHNGLIVASGDVGVGTTNPYSLLQVTGPDTATTSAFAVANSASTTVFAIYDNGNASYSGSIFQSSDQRLKTNITPLDASSSLSAIESSNPVSYLRLDQPGTGENLGFIAQQVQQIFPQLVSTSTPTALTPNGTLTLNYEGLISPIVSAIQDIASISGHFETDLIAWLGNASNGIGDLFADNIHANNELCIGTTCIDQAELQSLLAESGQSGDADVSSPAASLSTTTPPSIQIMGDNPAVIQVGDQYADLGAIATDSQGHNLGIQTYVNGSLESEIVIDTSLPATDTLDYVATDSFGNTATSTRTTIIQAPTVASSTAA